MLTTEIRINGNMIIYLCAINEGPLRGYTDECIYRYELYYPDSKKKIVHGKITHHRKDEALVLVAQILKDVLRGKNECKSKNGD